MLKRQKINTTKASVISVLSCIEKSGMQRNYRAEDSAYLDVFNDYYRQSYHYSLNNRDEIRARYKERLYECSENHWDNYVKDDEWFGETQLYNFQRWYEIKSQIKYTIDKIEYIKTITVNYENKDLPNDFLYITYNIDNPEEILSVSVNDISEFSVLPLVLMCGFLIILMLSLVVVYMSVY